MHTFFSLLYSTFTIFYSLLFSFILLYSFICRKDTANFRMNQSFSGKSNKNTLKKGSQ